MLGIVLGSGFSKLINHFDVLDSITYEEIISAKINPLEGHERKLYRCKHGQHELIILSGKLHYYEGYTEEECIRPLAYAINLYGLKKMIVTSASGALSKTIDIGNWYKIKAILSIPNIKSSSIKLENNGHPNQEGYSYNYHQGPSLGTLSEYKMLNKLGIDFVGMSMLHEGKYLNKTNIESEYYTLPVCNYKLNPEEPSFDQVVAIASKGVSKLSEMIKLELNK